MDRPISTIEQKKSQWGQWGRIGLVVAAVAAAFFLLRNVLTTEAEKKDFRYATVEVGDMENKITSSGLVVPSFEQQINAPIITEIKDVVLAIGTQVEAGDLIMHLDEEYIRLDYESLDDQLELRKNNITKLRLEYDKNLKDLDYEDQIKALELSSLEAGLADLRRLQGIGGATQEDVQRAELNLKIARLEKKKLENDLNFRKQAITSDRRNLELEVQIQEKKKRELGRKLKETSVKAPRSGVITWVNENIGQKVNEGEPLVRLANLESFRVEASVSDRYANIVQLGLPVKVRINNTDIGGSIVSILPAVENNTIAFVVQLAKADHKDLRPNMRVEVFLISGKKENVVRVQNGPAFKGATEQGIFVMNGGEAIKRQVSVGMVNSEFIEIVSSNLQPGEVVIVSDMEEFEHLERIALSGE